MFHLGRWAIALYLGRSTQPSAFGAAASFAALLLWLYYTAQIFLLGAEFTACLGGTRTGTGTDNVRKARVAEEVSHENARDKILIAARRRSLLLARRASRSRCPRSCCAKRTSRLMALEAYDGHVDDIDIALWRGAYRIDGIRIVKTGARQSTPFFSGDRIDCSVEWRSLLRGSLVAEGTFFRPHVNLVQAENEQQVAARHRE